MIYFFFSLVFLMLKTRKKTESVLAIFPNIWTTNILHKLSFLYILLCQNRFHSGYYYCHSVLSLLAWKQKVVVGSKIWMNEREKNFLSYTVFCAHVTFFCPKFSITKDQYLLWVPHPPSVILLLIQMKREGERHWAFLVDF